MKQVIVLSVKDFETELRSELKGLEILVFSKVDIMGYRNAQGSVDLSNWFASSKDPDFSVMYFAFVPDHVADQILDTIGEWNETETPMSPMHAYILPVERTI